MKVDTDYLSFCLGLIFIFRPQILLYMCVYLSNFSDLNLKDLYYVLTTLLIVIITNLSNFNLVNRTS